MRPLGGTRYESPIDDFVLAGRFEDRDVPAVINAVHANGGRVIERRSDTPRRLAPAVPTPGASGRTHHDARLAGGGTRRELRKRLRRPSPPRRVRTALRHRISD